MKQIFWLWWLFRAYGYLLCRVAQIDPDERYIEEYKHLISVESELEEQIKKEVPKDIMEKFNRMKQEQRN